VLRRDRLVMYDGGAVVGFPLEPFRGPIFPG
jgi:hypothetical protein